MSSAPREHTSPPTGLLQALQPWTDAAKKRKLDADSLGYSTEDAVTKIVPAIMEHVPSIENWTPKALIEVLDSVSQTAVRNASHRAIHVPLCRLIGKLAERVVRRLAELSRDELLLFASSVSRSRVSLQYAVDELAEASRRADLLALPAQLCTLVGNVAASGGGGSAACLHFFGWVADKATERALLDFRLDDLARLLLGFATADVRDCALIKRATARLAAYFGWEPRAGVTLSVCAEHLVGLHRWQLWVQHELSMPNDALLPAHARRQCADAADAAAREAPASSELDAVGDALAELCVQHTLRPSRGAHGYIPHIVIHPAAGPGAERDGTAGERGGLANRPGSPELVPAAERLVLEVHGPDDMLYSVPNSLEPPMATRELVGSAALRVRQMRVLGWRVVELHYVAWAAAGNRAERLSLLAKLLADEGVPLKEPPLPPLTPPPSGLVSYVREVGSDDANGEGGGGTSPRIAALARVASAAGADGRAGGGAGGGAGGQAGGGACAGEAPPASTPNLAGVLDQFLASLPVLLTPPDAVAARISIKSHYYSRHHPPTHIFGIVRRLAPPARAVAVVHLLHDHVLP